MTLTYTIRQFFQTAIFGGLLALCAGTLHAQPYLIHKDGAMVLDKTTGLVWQRCSVGQTWNGSTCAGAASTFTFAQANQQSSTLGGFTDWRTPTARQLQSLRMCSTGFGGTVDLEAGAPKVGAHCNNGSNRPTINLEISPGSQIDVYWSSSPYVGNSDVAWVVNFGNGYVGGYHRSNNVHVRLVRASQLLGDEVALDFVSLEAQRLIANTRLFGLDTGESYRTVSWKNSIQLSSDTYSGDVGLALASLIKVDQQPPQLSLPSQPSPPRDAASRKSPLTKGEFENTAQFTQRLAAADAKAQAEFDQDQRAYEAAQRDFAAAVKQQQDAQARALADSQGPVKYKALVAKHLPQAVALALGNPVLSDLVYDADKQVFNATLKSSRGAFSQSVSVAASQADAPQLKQDLLSQKIAPVVTLQLPNLTATWVLEENSALRESKFAQANHSAKKLLELIAEYPNSAEARAARPRIPGAQRDAYNAAARSDSSSAYQSFINEFAGDDTQKLLPQAEKAKQAAAQREERERIARAEQDRRDAAARDARERERIANACNAYYPGRKVGFKPAGFIYFGSTLDAVVLGKGNGSISIKIVDTHFKDDYGKTLEVNCTSDQLR